MKKLENDTRFIAVLLVSNLVIQTICSSWDHHGAIQILYLLATIAMSIYVVSGYKNKGTNIKLCVCTAIILLGAIIMALTEVINGFSLAYGVAWVVAISSYIISLSYPVLGMMLLNIYQLLAFIIELFGGSSVVESVKSLQGLWIISLIALIIQVILAKKTIKADLKLKDKLAGIITYERDAVRVNTVTHIVIWSLIITSISYIARTQLYEVMNSDMKYALYASASVTIPTFLIIGAATTSVIVVEIFGAYTLLEWYTMSYLLFIDEPNIHQELATVLIDTAILVYMIAKYRTQIKEHNKQKEVVKENSN